MRRLLTRAALAGLAGALAGAGVVWLAAASHSGFVFEMDRTVPPELASGMYPAERSGDQTWVWLAPRAQVTLPGVDRRVPWHCTLRFRGGRPEDVAQPDVRMSIDGASRSSASTRSTNDFQELAVTAQPLRGRRGLVLDVASTVTFRPPDDPRALGVLVDRLACEPIGSTRPPGETTRLAALGGAALGLAIALAGAPWLLAIGAAVVLAAAQAASLAIGPARLTAFPSRAAWLAVAIGAALVALAWGLRLIARRPLSAAAHAVLVISTGAAYLKLLGLLHPSKTIVDALYHAHRLEWVLAGRVYFTQVMPDGVEFPYAVALYLIAAPWTLVTGDLVTLLRVVVVVAEALAGGLLYVMVVRARGDRLAGVLAVGLFHAAPVAYPVLGNANFTNAFGQSVALAAIAFAVARPIEPRRAGQMAALTAVIALALLSHVSTFGLTIATMGCLGVAYRTFGGRALRPASTALLMCVGVAAIIAVGLYWAHFGETYRTLARVRADASATVPSSPAGDAGDLDAATRSTAGRVADALSLGASEFGWPLLLLAALGAWRTVTMGRPDRVSLAVLAWLAAYLVFLAFGTLAPVSGSYERYAAEFIGRVDLAVYPAVVLLAAAGAAWLWRLHAAGPLMAVAAVAAVAAGAIEHWRNWLV